MVIAIVMTIGDSPPFAPGDALVGVGYVAVYTTVASALLFTVGDGLVRSDYDRMHPALPPPPHSEAITLDVDPHAAASNGDVAEAHDPETLPTAKRKASDVSAHGDVELHVIPPSTTASTADAPANGAGAASPTLPAAEPGAPADKPWQFSKHGSSAAMLLGGHHDHDHDHDLDDHDQHNDHALGLTATGAGAAPPHWIRRLWLLMAAKLAPVGRVLWKLVTPPNVAVVAGLILGSIPQLMLWLLPPAMTGLDAPQAPLKFLFDTLTLVGNATVPLGLMNLGSALAKLKIRGAMKWSIVAAVTLSRLVVFPALGIGIVYLFTAVAHLPALLASPMLQFVLMIEAGVPTATFVLILTQLHGGDARNVAVVMVAQYAVLWLTVSMLIFAAMQVIQF